MSFNHAAPGCATGCNPDGTPCSVPNGQHIPCPDSGDCNEVPNNGTYYPRQFLAPLAGEVIPIMKCFKQGHSSLLKFFFDYENITEKTVDPKLVFKNLSMVNVGSFYDGGYFTWGERYYKPCDYYITTDYAAPTLTMQVGVQSGMDANGDALYTPQLADCYTPEVTLKPNDVVLIYRCDPEDPCCVQILTKTITAIDPATNAIVIEPGFVGDTGFTFCKGDKVKFMYSPRNDCCPITNKFPEQPSIAKRAYLQHFGYEICFNKCEINKAYVSKAGAMTSIQNKLFNSSLRMTRELGFAGYWARNRGSVCCGCETLPAEMQGILSGIFDSDARNPGLGLVSSVHRAKSAKDITKWLFCEILKAQNSGCIGKGDQLTFVMNEIAASAFLTWGQAWNSIRGVCCTQQTGNANQDVNFDFFTISTPGGKINMMTDPLLSEIYENEGVIIILPTKFLSMTARPNYKYNLMTGSIEKSQPGFRMEEIIDSKNHECVCYDVFTEIGTLIKGLDSGSFRFITGIRPVC